MREKSSAETIRVLEQWQGFMLKKGFPLFLYLRADAGTNFTSKNLKIGVQATTSLYHLLVPNIKSRMHLLKEPMGQQVEW